MDRFGMTSIKSESRRADPVLILLKNINMLLTNAKPKRTAKYTLIIKQLLSVLSGTDFDLIRSAEYYSDLKETLLKIFNQVQQTTKRRSLISRLVMASSDTQSVAEIQKMVDRLCGRIFMSYAQRRLMKKTSLIK